MFYQYRDPLQIYICSLETVSKESLVNSSTSFVPSWAVRSCALLSPTCAKLPDWICIPCKLQFSDVTELYSHLGYVQVCISHFACANSFLHFSHTHMPKYETHTNHLPVRKCSCADNSQPSSGHSSNSASKANQPSDGSMTIGSLVGRL